MSTRTIASPPQVEFFPSAPTHDHPLARGLAVIADDIRELRRFGPVVQNMVVQELRVRYQRSMLGFFWTLLNPILMMATLTVVFSQVFGQDPRNYAIYLFAGMIPWGLLSLSLSDCAYCIIANEGLIRKIYLPKLVFPLTKVLINLTTFVLSLVALFLLLIPLGARFSAPMLALPLAIVLFSAFTLGLGLLVATVNTFYRDCGHLVTVLLQAWYFATPIMYELQNFDGNRRWFLLNPALPFVRIFQAIIRDGQWPSLSMFAAAAALAALALGVGYVVFKCYEDKLIFRL
ncbi:MAG: ABC transporter permease [Isosphaeraceae bacterium]|nr:ABC transporter permease [Isosphaeraceae bacterium]